VCGDLNGLTMLLQGSLGTFKTLLTVGNDRISIHLGKAWNCLLALDQAHNLLQGSPISGPGKEAIASNILEHLGRYNGTVILISSPMGVFDERIISRVQIPLLLETLNQPS
jgi:uridine kinase